MRYHAFVLTVWQEGEPLPNAPPRWRYSLEYPSTGERHGFKNSDELLHFINQWMVDPSPGGLSCSEEHGADSPGKD